RACYTFECRVVTTANTGIYRLIAGSGRVSLLALPALAVPLGSTIRLEAEGTTLTAYVDGVEVGSVEDGNLTTQTRAGLLGTAGATNRVRFDAFEAGTINP